MPQRPRLMLLALVALVASNKILGTFLPFASTVAQC
jgi:hypothetical protein